MSSRRGDRFRVAPKCLRNSSRGCLARQQRGDRLTAAVRGNGSRKIGQRVQLLEVTSFGDGQQASRGQLAGDAAVAKADLAPLHTGSERPFAAVVGRLHTVFVQEQKEPLVVLEKGRCQIAKLAALAYYILL